jgi:hypothetical protein
VLTSGNIQPTIPEIRSFIKQAESLLRLLGRYPDKQSIREVELQIERMQDILAGLKGSDTGNSQRTPCSVTQTCIDNNSQVSQSLSEMP